MPNTTTGHDTTNGKNKYAVKYNTIQYMSDMSWRMSFFFSPLYKICPIYSNNIRVFFFSLSWYFHFLPLSFRNEVQKFYFNFHTHARGLLLRVSVRTEQWLIHNRFLKAPVVY